jgi:hypothetical protein
MAVMVLGDLGMAVVLNMLVVPALFLRYGVDGRAPARPRCVGAGDGAGRGG